MTCGTVEQNMTFSFFYPYLPLNRPDTAWHERKTCAICQEQDKQIAALKVHCLSRSFQYRTRCGE